MVALAGSHQTFSTFFLVWTLGLAEMRRMINDCEEDEKENQGVMMTSNAGEADKAEFSPLPSPQTGALPSHHHLLYILTIGVDYKVDD